MNIEFDILTHREWKDLILIFDILAHKEGEDLILILILISILIFDI